MLPDVSAETSQITILIALLAGVLTFIEYNTNFPSIVEYRDAPPFNRLRFGALFMTVFMLSTIVRGQTDPTLFTGALTSIGWPDVVASPPAIRLRVVVGSHSQLP